MDFVQNDPMLKKKLSRSFTLPLVLIVMMVVMFFFQETVLENSRSIRINQGLIEKIILNEIMSVATKTMEKNLRVYGIGNVAGSGSFRERIASNPKLYLDMNGDGIVDSLALYTFINLSTTKIEFAMTAYRLNGASCGVTDHPWLTTKMEPTSIRLVKILSNSYSTHTQMSKFIQYSIKIENGISLLDQVILEKKLNLISND